MRTLNATKKGLVTGSLMIICSILIFLAKGSFQNNLQYITYLLYVGGIIWTLLDFRKESTSQKFKNFFSQGFKCFVVVTFLMVLFTIGFILLNPEVKEEMALTLKAEMIKGKNLTPNEIEQKIQSAKKFFMPAFIMTTVFGYLLIGVVFTTIGSGILAQKKTGNFDE